MGTPVIHKMMIKFWKIKSAYSTACSEIASSTVAIKVPSMDNIIVLWSPPFPFNMDNKGPEIIITGKK